MWKWLLGGLVVLVLLCGGGSFALWMTPSVRQGIQRFMPGEKPAKVRVEAAGRGTLTRTVAAPGQIEPKTSVKISAQVSARIVALPFRENERVKKGDVIVRLDARDLEALVAAARAGLRGEEARLEGAQERLAYAVKELARASKLAATGDVAASALEQAESDKLRAESDVRVAREAIERARQEIVRAEKDLDNTVITSPIDGTITRLDAEVGELVVVGTLNSPGSVVMEIADLASMVLKARVDESNVVPVKDGQRARVFVNAYGEREFKGTVERVELQRKVDRDNTGYFEVWVPIELEGGETLRSGLTANTEIVVETIADVLVVPSQAVVDKKVDELPRAVVEGSGNIPKGAVFARVVYRVEDAPGRTTLDGVPLKKVVVTPVQVGASDLTRTVVLAGLKEGDRIVTGPFKELQGLSNEREVIEDEGVKGKEPASGAAAQASGAGH